MSMEDLIAFILRHASDIKDYDIYTWSDNSMTIDFFLKKGGTMTVEVIK